MLRTGNSRAREQNIAMGREGIGQECKMLGLRHTGAIYLGILQMSV